MKYWILTDFHLGHREKMVKWCGRPENYETMLFEALRAIPETNVLIYLGDYCIGNDEYWHKSHIMKFNYLKWLIRGNHDKKSPTWYLEHGWHCVCDALSLNYFGKKIVFSHIPLKDNGYDVNIHGHFHNSDHRRHEPDLVEIKNDKQILVKIEHGYKPFDLKKIIGQ